MSNNPTAELAANILFHLGAPVSTAPVFVGLASGDNLGASVAALQTGVGFMQLIGKEVSNPWACQSFCV